MLKLTGQERDFLMAARGGRPYAAEPDTADGATVLRAKVVRAAILGLPLLDGERDDVEAPLSVTLENVEVVGDLDLADTGGDGTNGPALLFTRCTFGRITMANSRFGRLSMIDCRLILLDASGVRIAGDVDVSGVRSAERNGEGSGCADGQGDEVSGCRCQIDFSGASIDGSFRASRATLCAPPKNDDFDRSAGGIPAALMLRRARIGGMVLLQPDFVAIGGANLSDAQIDGTVWLQGARLKAEWDDALSLKSAIIKGAVALSGLFRQGRTGRPFVSDGAINLYSARIDGELYMEGARLRVRDASELTVNGFMAQIGKLVRISALSDPYGTSSSIPFESHGPINFQLARLSGFWADGAIIDGLGGPALNLTDTHIEGDFRLSCSVGEEQAVTVAPAADTPEAEPDPDAQTPQFGTRQIIHRAICRGSIELTDAVISGRMDLYGVRIEGRAGTAIEGSGTRIGNAVRLLVYAGQHQLAAGQEAGRKVVATTIIDGTVNFGGARLQGGFIAEYCRLEGEPVLLVLDAIDADGEVRITDLTGAGAVRIRGAKIRNGLTFTGALQAANNPLMFARETTIGGELEIRVDGDRRLDFRDAVVSGSASIAGSIGDPQWSLLLDRMDVGGDLDVRAIGPGSVSLERTCVTGTTRLLSVIGLGWAGSEPMIDLRGGRFNGTLHIGSDEGIAVRPPVSVGELKLLRSRPAEGLPGWQLVEAFCVTARTAGTAGWLWDGAGRCLNLSGVPTPVNDLIRSVEEAGGAVDRPALERLILPWYNPQAGLRIRDALVTPERGGDRAGFMAQRSLDPDRPWPLMPLDGADWTDLADDPLQAAAAIAALSLREDLTVRRVRVRPLIFYPGWVLAHGLVDRDDGQQTVLRWLWDGAKDARLLDNQSTVIHAFNSDLPPRLDSDEHVKAYVRFFCDHLAGEDRSTFLVVDDADELPFPEAQREDRAGAIEPLHILSREVVYHLNGTVVYDGQLFRIQFRLHPSGLVEMLNDVPLPVEAATMTRTVEGPFLLPVPASAAPPATSPAPLAWPELPDAGSAAPMSDAAATAFRAALERSAESARIPVEFAAAHARELDDDFGRAWGHRTRLRLGGFTYDQLDRVKADSWLAGRSVVSGDDAAALRLRWLSRQARDWPPPSGHQFDAQPHTQLAQAYRAVGRTEEARRITFDKMRIDSGHATVAIDRWLDRLHLRGLLVAVAVAAIVASFWLPTALALAEATAVLLFAVVLVPRLLNWSFRFGFGYGLYPANALATFAACLLAGWVGVEVANRGAIGPISFAAAPQVLEVDVATVNGALRRVAAPIDTTPALDHLGLAPPLNAVVPTTIPCGEQIEPFLYAADVFIPLIDLRQEPKCSPSGTGAAAAWQWAKALYAVLGWVVTSLTILTVSGVLRARSEQ